MQNKAKEQFAEPTNRRGDTPTSRQQSSRSGPLLAALAVSLLCGGVAAAEDGNSPTRLRQFIDEQVGGIEKLMVPADDADLPQARLPDGSDASADPRFKTTEAKRYLGKQLFHDPIRTARILPQFGGVLATKQTASCGSCHQGESASKAGTLFNFAVGGEGRSYTDAQGNFIPRRRPRVDILPKLRDAPLFPGDALVDELPTLTDIYAIAGVASPARSRKLPPPGALLRTGRLDALDSVARNAPAVLGAAFNNRLLMGGFAGEPDASPGGLNPFNFPAQESVALLLLDAHRMLDFQSAELQKFATYRKLFQDAFPEEAAQADAKGDLNLLINDITVLRATATFMRTAVTRDTPWDRFLAGDDRALSSKQRRGAKLFFTKADEGGAGCYSCHSGPMLNKQANDPDLAGVGQFVEENFYNLGLGDHPLQALNRLARKDPNFLDDGRREITGRGDDAFKFRVLTLRQLKDARFFFHNGSFTSVRGVVQYFNAGVPQNAMSGAASTLTTRFTNPRGTGSPRGLGLSDDQVDDLTDFVENGLYDPAFVRFEPDSPTKMFQLSPPDFLYSVYRPDLAALGAIDGRPASGLLQDNNDPLSRRDAGLEFLDVTPQVGIALIESKRIGDGRQEDVYKITNNSSSIVDTHLLMVANGLSNRIEMENASGITSTGDPYRRVFLANGVLLPGESIVESLLFERQRHDPPVTYTLTLLSGQGNP
jgi:cytochrome c peroxidase